MEKFLEKIFSSEFYRKPKSYEETELYKELDLNRRRATDRLYAAVEDADLVDNWMTAIHELYELEEREVFRKGFSLAVHLFFEGASEPWKENSSM